MLKPKYVHGVNAEEAQVSLLRRLRSTEGAHVWPLPPGNPDDLGGGDPNDGTHINWSWTIG